MSLSDQEGVKSARKSLKTLQQTSDRENLVGRASLTKSLKHQLSQESLAEQDVKRRNPSKETQANLDSKVTVDDLTNPDGPSETYWKILAEKRNVALQDALDENEKLRKVIEDLKEENKLYKQMLDEANTFVEVIKEELANADNNDTGIDVNDVSTAEETETDRDETAFDTTNEGGLLPKGKRRRRRLR